MTLQAAYMMQGLPQTHPAANSFQPRDHGNGTSIRYRSRHIRPARHQPVLYADNAPTSELKFFITKRLRYGWRRLLCSSNLAPYAFARLAIIIFVLIGIFFGSRSTHSHKYFKDINRHISLEGISSLNKGFFSSWGSNHSDLDDSLHNRSSDYLSNGHHHFDDGNHHMHDDGHHHLQDHDNHHLDDGHHYMHDDGHHHLQDHDNHHLDDGHHPHFEPHEPEYQLEHHHHFDNHHHGHSQHENHHKEHSRHEHEVEHFIGKHAHYHHDNHHKLRRQPKKHHQHHVKAYHHEPTHHTSGLESNANGRKDEYATRYNQTVHNVSDQALGKKSHMPQFEFIKLKSLPKTAWLRERSLAHFKLHYHRNTKDNLITLKNACYCTRRKKFILPRRKRHRHHSHKFPLFMYRYGLAYGVDWNSPDSLLSFKTQRVVKVPGTTIFWRGRGLHVQQAHLQKSLIPLRSVIDILKQSRNDKNIYLAAESLTEWTKANSSVSNLHDYYLGDVPKNNRISIQALRPNLVCFNEVISLGSEFENHAGSSHMYDHIKSLIEKKEKDRLDHRLARKCQDSNANNRTIWIMDKQQAHGQYSSIENIGEVTAAVEHALIKAGLASSVAVHVVGSSSGNFQPNGDVFEEAIAYNNMTFLITAVGPSNQGVIYMPTGSRIIGILPYGILDHDEEHLATDAGLKYVRMKNNLDEDFERMLHDRFGDIARSTRTCWADAECHAARLSRATHVNIHQLKMLLGKAIEQWSKAC